MPSTEVVPKDEEALALGAVANINEADLELPVIKITQQLSRAVTDKEVESGRFYNAVTGEDYGDEIDFVVCGYERGRFYVADRGTPNEKNYVARGEVAPDTWPEEYAGKRFEDIPDAEEQWKARSNSGEIEWGHGPPIVTTHNYVGFVASEPGVPARLGLSRTSAPAARKINTLLKFGGRAPWASSIKLKLTLRGQGNKPYYAAQAFQGEQSSPEIVEAAKALATAVQQAGAFALDGSEVEDGDAPSKAKKPDAPKGGVKV